MPDTLSNTLTAIVIYYGVPLLLVFGYAYRRILTGDCSTWRYRMTPYIPPSE